MINKEIDRQAMIGYMLTCLLLIFIFLLTVIFRKDNQDFLLKEGGLIESASVFGYFICAAFIIYKRKVACLKHFFALIIFFMLRELDFHKRFTTMGIFKSRFFTSNDVPLVEKFIGAAVILFLMYIAAYILFRYSKDFFTGLRKKSAVSLGVLLTFILLVVSKSMDGLAKKLRWFGIALSEQMSIYAGAFEEIIELGIPIVIFLTLSAYFKSIKAEGTGSRTKKACP